MKEERTRWKSRRYDGIKQTRVESCTRIVHVGYDKVDDSLRAVQFLTGHDNLKSYLRRFALRDTDGKYGCVQITLRRGKMLVQNELKKVEEWASRVLKKEEIQADNDDSEEEESREDEHSANCKISEEESSVKLIVNSR